MNRSPRVIPTGRPHLFGEHGPDVQRMAFRHHNVDATPLIIALGFLLLIFAALVWYCLSAIFRGRANRIRYADDHDPEAAVANELNYSGSSFADRYTQHGPSSGQNAKEGLQSTGLSRDRLVTFPGPVHDPFRNDKSSPNYTPGPKRERSRSLSSLSLPCPSYPTHGGSFSTLSEQDLRPPPEYSSLLSSPSNTTSTPQISITATQPLEVGTENGILSTSLIPAAFSAPDISCLIGKPAETLSGVSHALNRTLSSPERYTALGSLSAPLVENGTSRHLGTFVDQSECIIPQQSLPPESEQTVSSASIITIRPCHMIPTARDLSDAGSLPSHTDLTSWDSGQTITAFASPYDGISRTPDLDKGRQDPKLTPQSSNGNLVGISA